MRKLLLLVATTLPLFVQAQILSDFESLPLPTADTYYINKTPPLADRGFDNGSAHFQYAYDTSYGGFWASGFAYSNKTDTVTSGYLNQYSAKAGKGVNGSSKYVVHWQGYSGTNENLILTGASKGKTQTGFFVTNSTYAYNSMRDGDVAAKKFGDTSGNRSGSDFFMLTTYGYLNGTKKNDSVTFYLADFRDTINRANNYIVKDWRFVNLGRLGGVDSLSFKLSSSDTSGGFGMNTPAYFCMDNFMAYAPFGVEIITQHAAKVYPNPATNLLNVEIMDPTVKEAAIYDFSGRFITSQPASQGKLGFNIDGLSQGVYLLKLQGTGAAAGIPFIKK